MTPKRIRRTFTPEFKSQMVQLYESGKPRIDILRKYDLTASSFDNWVRQSQNSGSFSEKDKRTPEENEMIKLRIGDQSTPINSFWLFKKAVPYIFFYHSTKADQAYIYSSKLGKLII